MAEEKPTVAVTILKAMQMVSSKFKVAACFQFYLLSGAKGWGKH